MSLSVPGILRAAALAAAAVVACLASSVVAAPMPPDQFPLGQSPKSGLVCQATRSPDAPGANTRGARAWDIGCRGFDTPLGALYAYGYRGDKAVGPGGLWTATLGAKAHCADAKPVTLAGLASVGRADCQKLKPAVAYIAYHGSSHGRAVTADGYVQIADVLETGLRVVAGAIPPPKPTEALVASSVQEASSIGSLAEAIDQAANSPEHVRELGYSRNISWSFSDAADLFRNVALDRSASDQLRAEAYLNWALNSSDAGAFEQAGKLFVKGDRLAGADPGLRALSQSYRALDLRNQRRFKESIVAAEAARTIFFNLQPSVRGSGAGLNLSADAHGGLEIDDSAASALRSRSSALGLNGLDPALRVRVQIAQADLTEATSAAALGDAGTAEKRLQEAHEILALPALRGVANWLRAQVEAEMARQAEAAGRIDEASSLLVLALSEIRVHQAGTSDEAELMMEIARLDELAGRHEQAIKGFQSAIALFRETRGSLGTSGSAGAAASIYLDLLISQFKSDPAHAQDAAERFMTAIQSLGSVTTAKVIARMSARVNQADTAEAGLIRELEDTKRQVRIKQSENEQLLAQNAYTPAIKAVSDAELATLKAEANEIEQKLEAADPKYGVLITSDVSLKDLQTALKPGELYLKVSMLADKGYGLAITPSGATPYRIELGRGQAGALVAELRAPFEAQNRLPVYAVDKSYAYFLAMFGPVQDQLRQARHVIYEPDDAIIGLPIAALATDQASVDLIAARRSAIRAKGRGVLSYDGVAWLGRTADTSLVVSPAAFVQSRNLKPSSAKHAYLGMGDSVTPPASDPKAYASVAQWGVQGEADEDVCAATRDVLLELKPLKEASGELKSVGASLNPSDMELLTGPAFSDAAVTHFKDLDQYRVLYFATHGLLPRPGGCMPEPALLTSVDDSAADAENDGDGLLTASKILELKLDADLVVLSACDTRGGGVAGDKDLSGLGGAGEALNGLTRAFLYAGARGLVVSHWQVDSKATVRLMSAMFASHAASQAGALHEASLGLMNSPDQYSHPYYWAAFTVVGDGARPMPVR